MEVGTYSPCGSTYNGYNLSFTLSRSRIQNLWTYPIVGRRPWHTILPIFPHIIVGVGCDLQGWFDEPIMLVTRMIRDEFNQDFQTCRYELMSYLFSIYHRTFSIEKFLAYIYIYIEGILSRYMKIPTDFNKIIKIDKDDHSSHWLHDLAAIFLR